VTNAAELATELQTIATKMRELGVVRLKTPDVEIELGALVVPPTKPARELTDNDFMFAATEGVALDDESEAG